MEQTKLQELKDLLWKTKNEDEWWKAVETIGKEVEGDDYARKHLNLYYANIKDKKFKWFEDAKNKPKYPQKQPVFNEATQLAMQNALNAIADYYRKKTEKTQLTDNEVSAKSDLPDNQQVTIFQTNKGDH